jgi:hypothetical protein
MPVVPAKSARIVTDPADLDNLELLVAAIIAEASNLKALDRRELATRVLSLGAYESPDASASENERARLALRLAARLAQSAN